MLIEIHDNKTIGDIQLKFNSFFHFLNIEFYEHPHHLYEESPVMEAYPSNIKLFDIRKNHDHGDFEIHSWHKTGFVEQTLRKKYGLNAQIIRLFGNDLLQTVRSDKLNLEEQNELAKNNSVISKKNQSFGYQKGVLF